MKFSNKDSFSKCDLLRKSLMENFICAVAVPRDYKDDQV